ncbi:MAG TPA: amino acid adenylation domain-containing protein, partial [Herpetosiphonaceae bacterium]
DQQVKLRGYRIELGEIEAVLRQHEAVRDAVVLLREERGDTRLVAYVVEQSTTEPSTTDPVSADLRPYLHDRLPAYMVPSAFVFLAALPLTPNGKVDRRALPPPEDRREARGVAPRTTVEVALAEIWAAVLGVAEVRVGDSFFALGGHSLLATHLLARVRAQFGVAVALRTLFEGPTLAALAEAITQAQADAVPPIAPVAHAGPLALSFAQQRLWFLDQLQPGSAAYVIPIALHLNGVLDLAALEASLNDIVQRHATLRTTFAQVQDQPVQVIAPTLRLELTLVDLQALPEPERSAEARRISMTEARTPFDLQRGPLVRATLLRLSEQEHRLLLTFHHIITDGWSMGVLIRECAACYAARITGQAAALPDLPIQYADYTVWQRGWMQGAVLEGQLGYWRQQLAGISPLELPTDRPRPATPTYQGAREMLALSPALSTALQALSQQFGATLFMALLAAFQTLLHRYSGQREIVVGTPIANRTHGETQGLIGFFANTLVLRTDLAGDPSFAEALRWVRNVALEAYAHQDVPFEMLVEALQPERDMTRQPFFQVLFVLQNLPMPALHLPNMTITPVDVDNGTAKFDLSLTITPTEQGLSALLEYSTDLFDAATIRRMLGHFEVLLAGAVAQPEQPLGALPLLTSHERHLLLGAWNATTLDYPQDRSIQQLFEAQADRTPDLSALIFDDVELTYRELNGRANQLAHHLRALGVGRAGREVYVGLCFQRSVDQIVAALGVLKAGGAYVPLDPAYPRERLRLMLEDAGVSLILTHERLRRALPDGAARVLCLDAAWERIEQEPAINLPGSVLLDGVVYITFTSGSTGRPKGIAMVQRALLNLLHWQRRHNMLPPGARTLQFASLSFDVSFQDMFSTWLSGGTVVGIAEETRRDLADLARVLRDQSIQRMFIPAVALQQVAEGYRPAEHGPLPLRQIIAGSEQLNLTPAITALLAQHPGCTLHNEYGPSETHVVTAYALPRSPANWPKRPPVGRPIDNTSIYLLDRRMQPVPIGIPGELYIGGVGLARGYSGRPDLTAERFIPDPFAQGAAAMQGARMYRTGDLARYLADGNIEYLGRIDQQVKLRGFRVEPGEIEAALARHEAVRECVVLAREDHPGEKRLVAYVVEQRNKEQRNKEEHKNPDSCSLFSVLCSPQELRQFLGAFLPDYMIPSAFVFLDRLPLNVNGKIDRKALPAPDVQPADMSVPYAAPRTPIEELVAAIWAQVLRVGRVGRHDRFFELGGHSLLATQLVSRLRDTFRVELPLRTLFEAPTVAELAARIEAARETAHAIQMSPITRIDRDRPLPLSFAQQRLWFLDRLEPESAAYVIASVVRLRGRLDLTALERSVQAIIARHEMLRTTFVQGHGLADDQRAQVIASSVDVPLTRVDLQGLSAQAAQEAVERWIRQAAEQPFDLQRGPLLRMTVFEMADREHVLALLAHHIITDGWSMGVLIGETATLYQAYVGGSSEPAEQLLPPLTIQYVDYAQWQRQWMQGALLEEHLAYWKRQLVDVPVLDLPTDRPRPPVQTTRGGRLSLRLPQEVSAELSALSRREGVTLFMTLLAAFAVLLHRYSDQDEIIVGTPIAGRTRSEIEGVIGLFVNTLVLRADLSGNPSFRELLMRVREVCLGAYAHQHLPFEQLVDTIQPERDLSRNPLFQVMFILQNTPLPTLELPDLVFEPLEIDTGTAMFDLTLAMVEADEGLSASFEYNTDLFDAAMIARMAAQFQAVLERVVVAPEQALIDLPIPNDAERDLLRLWSVTARAAEGVACVHTLVEAQAERTPQALALVDEHMALTYQELNRRANQVAHRLRSLGAGPDARVAICMERSPELIVGLLGILKAGGAYVPLDPAYPAARLAWMLEDARASLVLTQPNLRALLPAPSVHVECFDATWSAIDGECGLNLSSDVTPDNLAYIIYTSGSTGTPKGVMVEHRSAAAYTQAAQREYAPGPDDRVLQFASISFDASAEEIYPCLASGATLVLRTDAMLQSFAAFVQACTTLRLTVLDLPTAYWHELVASLESEALALPSNVRLVIIGGEAALPERLAAWHRLVGARARLVNTYGPTETTIVATQHDLTLADRESIVPIGRPVRNAQTYILNRQMRLSPIGVPGELYIGGAGVARGYWQRPDLTAERFIPDPFSGTVGARLYKTGDLARWLPDGTIAFVGRRDEQVKIRGFRIELGEIEAVLRQHEAVREAVVLASEERGYKRLVAYVVAHQNPEQRNTGTPEHGPRAARAGGAGLTAELRAFLAARLPDYMVPSAFVVLDALPLTPNGKLDRRALPAPDATRSHAPTALVAPRTHVEEALAQIWAAVLRVAQVGRDDDFFA